jgi:hypothetical protein
MMAIRVWIRAWLKLAADLEANQTLLAAYPPPEPIDGAASQRDAQAPEEPKTPQPAYTDSKASSPLKW